MQICSEGHLLQAFAHIKPFCGWFVFIFAGHLCEWFACGAANKEHSRATKHATSGLQIWPLNQAAKPWNPISRSSEKCHRFFGKFFRSIGEGTNLQPTELGLGCCFLKIIVCPLDRHCPQTLQGIREKSTLL